MFLSFLWDSFIFISSSEFCKSPLIWTVVQTLRQHWVEMHSKRDNVKSTHLEYAHFVLENVFFFYFDLAHQKMTWYLSFRLFSDSIEDSHFVCVRDCTQRYLNA